MPAARNNEPLPHLTVRAALTRDLPTHAPGMASALRVHLCASSSRARVELRPGHPALRRGEGLLRCGVHVAVDAQPTGSAQPYRRDDRVTLLAVWRELSRAMPVALSADPDSADSLRDADGLVTPCRSATRGRGTVGVASSSSHNVCGISRHLLRVAARTNRKASPRCDGQQVAGDFSYALKGPGPRSKARVGVGSTRRASRVSYSPCVCAAGPTEARP